MPEPVGIGYTPGPTRPTRTPVVVSAVLIELQGGAVLRFPVSPPARLERMAKRIELISSKAYVSCD